MQSQIKAYFRKISHNFAVLRYLNGPVVEQHVTLLIRILSDPAKLLKTGNPWRT